MKFVAVALCAAALFASCESAEAQETADRLNADRATYGLRALPTNDMLNAKAQAWAERLARENTLYHSNLPDGITGCWRSIGENVGYGGSIAIVEQAYMNSSGHRANILGTQWNRVGTGVAWNGPKVFTVQVFEQAC
jgi:uncharacterized protein YkwD